MTTNLVAIHAIEITLRTQKTGQITIPVDLRKLLDLKDGHQVFITKGNGERERFELVSGGELYTYNFLPGDSMVRIRLSKD